MLGAPLTGIFTRAVHELDHNNGCGPLPHKKMQTPDLTNTKIEVFLAVKIHIMVF